MEKNFRHLPPRGGGVFFQNIEHIFCTPFLSPGKEFLRNNPTSSKHKYVIELVES